MIDYKELLRKYVDHVLTCEGTTFISNGFRFDGYFTDEEWEVLKELKGPEIIHKGPFTRSEEWTKGLKSLLLNDLEAAKSNRTLS